MTGREVAFNQDIKALVVADGILPLYLQYYLMANRSRLLKLVDSAGHGTGRLNTDLLKRFSVVVPSIKAQANIAHILSTWDLAIERAERLIRAKERQFSWLLNGLVNQNNFGGEWQRVKLGEIAEIKTGDKDNQNKISDGEYPFFVRSQKVERIDTFSFDGEAILIPGEGKIGEVIHYINGKFDYHQRVYKISDFSEFVLARFLFYYLKCHFPKHAATHAVKATADSLRLPSFTEMDIAFPHLDLQEKIVQTLSSTQNEIDLLKKQTDAYHKQKRGLMQKLLTGQ